MVVPDADALYRRVKAAGGNMVIAIKDEDYGGRGFSFLDLEEHLWNVGTYDPWSIKLHQGCSKLHGEMPSVCARFRSRIPRNRWARARHMSRATRSDC
jgi:hypothetical protein